VAAISAMNMLMPCSRDLLTATDYSDNYHGIVSIVLSVSLMLSVDLIFAGTPASRQAEDAICAAMELLSKTVTDFFSEDLVSPTETPRTEGDQVGTVQKFLDGLGAAQDKVDTAVSMNVAAGQEPRWWKAPWRSVLLSKMTANFTDIISALTNFGKVIKDAPAETRKRTMRTIWDDQAFRPMLEEITQDLDYLVKMSTFLIHNHDTARLEKNTWKKFTKHGIKPVEDPEIKKWYKDRRVQTMLDALNQVAEEGAAEAYAGSGKPKVAHSGVAVVIELMKTITHELQRSQQNIIESNSK